MPRTFRVQDSDSLTIDDYLRRCGAATLLKDDGQTRELLTRCPAHDDDNPSLVIFDHHTGPKAGSVGIHCRARCEWSDVIAAFTAIEPADAPCAITHGSSRTARTGRKAKLRRRADVALQIQCVRLRRDLRGGTIPHDPDVPAYGLRWLADYTGVSIDFLKTQSLDADNTGVSFCFEGFAPIKRRAANSKGFVWKPKGAKPHPLIWPTLPAAPPRRIIIAEGETDALVLRSLGHEAYALAGGCGTRLPASVWRWLKGAGCDVVTLALDADAAGESGAARLRKDATDAGLTVTALDPSPFVEPRLGQNDWRDAFKRHGPALREMIDAHEAEQARKEAIAIVSAGELTRDTALASTYALDQWLPMAASTLVVGPGNCGKTTFFAGLFDAMRDGAMYLGYATRRGNVLVLSENEGAAFANKLRAYPHMDHVFCMFPSAAYGNVADWAGLADEVIKAARNRDVALVVIDTLGTWSQIDDFNDYALVLQAMETANRIAAHGFAVALVHHQRKSGGTGLEAALGSAALGARVTGGYIQMDRDGDTGTLTLVRSHHAAEPFPTVHTVKLDGRLQRTDAPKKAQAQQAADTVLDFLVAVGPDGATASETADYLNIDVKTARKRLRGLVSRDAARAEETTGRGGKVERFYANTPALVRAVPA